MMQDALLVAKGLALQEKQPEVRREEFFHALMFFTLDGRPPVLRKILAQQRELVGEAGEIEHLAPILPQLMDDARRAGPLPLAEDLQVLLKQLRMNAVSLTMKPLPGTSAPSLPPALAESARVRGALQAGMFGQERATLAMTRYLAFRDDERARRLKGVFVLAGPPASGKSLAAWLLAQGLGPDYRLWSYDCSNITSIYDRSVFDGSPTTISGAQPGELTDFVRQHPRSVVVLEHFDRMHPAVQAFLLPLLETGFLKDMHGFYENFDKRDMSNSKKIVPDEVDFRETCLVITCEAGADLYESPALVERLRAEGGEAQVRSALLASLAAARNEQSNPPGACFSPSVLSRLAADGAVVLMQPLDWQALLAICRDELAAAQKQLVRTLHGQVRLHIAPATLDSLVPLLVLAEGGQADPRRLGRARLSDSLFGPLCDRWLAGQAVGDRIELRLTEADAALVAAMVADLGEDPVRTLFRTRRRLLYDIAWEDDAKGAGTVLCCRNPRLVKVLAGADHQGPGALLIDVPEMTLDQVAGQETVKDKLRRQVALMRDGRALARHGLRPPGGCLLHGPPGTGKTTLARAFAGEAGLPFLAVTGPELLDLNFQRSIFARLRNYAPAVLFIDELDAIGRRGQGADPAINNLLAEIDGFGVRTGEPIFVIGATNLRDKIDTALLRPGRLEFSFAVNAPDRAARRFLLERIAERLTGGVGEALLDYSSGMSGAQIEAACREILLVPGPLDAQQARMLLEEVVFGRQTDLPEALRRAIAYHEAGHAVAAIRGGSARVDYVSLTAREGNAGHVWSSSSIGQFTAARARAIIASALAGRVAQCLYDGDLGEGADSGDMEDLHKATHLAWHAVGHLGLDPVVGPVALPKKDDNFAMPGLAQQVEERVRLWLTEAEQTARELLQAHWPEVEAVAAELLEQGALAHDRLLAVMDAAGAQAARPRHRRMVRTAFSPLARTRERG